MRDLFYGNERLYANVYLRGYFSTHNNIAGRSREKILQETLSLIRFGGEGEFVQGMIDARLDAFGL